MPTGGRPTLTQFLIEERRRHPDATGDLNALVTDVSLACKAISRKVAFGALADMLGKVQDNTVNVQGEEQKTLDVVSNQMFLRAAEWGGIVAGMVSEEMEEVYHLPKEFPRGKYLLLFDPLDGSSNTDVNVSVGSIFSVLRAATPGQDAKPEDFLQPGTQQVCAGYAIYGPSTMLVLTLGTGTHAFTLDAARPEAIAKRIVELYNKGYYQESWTITAVEASQLKPAAASINAIAFSASRFARSASGSLRKAVPARFSSVSHPTFFTQPRSVSR